MSIYIYTHCIPAPLLNYPSINHIFTISTSFIHPLHILIAFHVTYRMIYKTGELKLHYLVFSLYKIYVKDTKSKQINITREFVFTVVSRFLNYLVNSTKTVLGWARARCETYHIAQRNWDFATIKPKVSNPYSFAT